MNEVYLEEKPRKEVMKLAFRLYFQVTFAVNLRICVSETYFFNFLKDFS